jgi:hypothetical protein
MVRDLWVSATDGIVFNQVEIVLPNIKVGAGNGFRIEGLKARLERHGTGYSFAGQGTFVLPGLGGEGDCRIGIEFELYNLGLHEAGLSIRGCGQVPIDTTGFFLTGVSGRITLEASSIAIDVSIDIAGGPNIPGLGYAVSGSPGAHIDTAGEFGLSGNLNLMECLEAPCWANRLQKVASAVRAPPGGAVARLRC